MLSPEEYRQYDATALSALVQTGEVSAAELLECAIEQAESLNPELNAIVFQAWEEARQQAHEFDKAPAHGPLAGVPFLIKEISAVRNWPLTRASRLFKDDVAHDDSAIVQRFRRGGLILFGKTNTPELCLTLTTESKLYGASHNPRAPGFSSGGSSGGAAAAVAAGIVPAAHGSDGGGSIRVPASCCGLFGLKPSRGLSIVEDDIGEAWSGMSVGHVLSRTVRDSAAFLDLLRLQEPKLFPLPAYRESFYHSHSRQPGVLRIAVQRQHPTGHPVHEICLQALSKATQLCESLGFSVEEKAPPVDYEGLGKAMAIIINIHVAQIILPQLEEQGLSLEHAPLEEATRRTAASGGRVSATAYLQAMETLRQAERQMQEFHQQYDLIMSPVLAQPPAELGWLDMDGDIKTYASRFSAYSGFAALYNATGQPSASLPLHRTAAGLPVGVMFSAAWGHDHLLLQLSHLLEQSTDSWKRT